MSVPTEQGWWWLRLGDADGFGDWVVVHVFGYPVCVWRAGFNAPIEETGVCLERCEWGPRIPEPNEAGPGQGDGT